ncbi:MAG: uroporphyrinogen decarboxylase family protein [Sedimentisphaerales bacterium]|jgi:uroporphyrinogen decarboxylase
MGQSVTRKPDFENLLEVLHCQIPGRPTLFEFFLNGSFYEKLTGRFLGVEGKDWKWGAFNPIVTEAFRTAGYDYVTVLGSSMKFETPDIERKATISLNAGSAITDRESFESYGWPDPDAFDYSSLELAKETLPAGMKLIVYGPCGVLENVISLVGFERLCMLLADDADLAKDIFDAVGSRLVRYYEICAAFDTVGALIVNDDWGFKTATMFSPVDLRRYVFGWTKKIVEVIHKAGKPAILHSCGNLDRVMDDIIDDMKFDAKHSFEDVIIPVEQAYEKWGGRIAILGGIDMDFMCRSTPKQIRQRCEAMLAKAATRGGYALGTGNSVPEYVPFDNYIAMIDCVRTKDPAK